MAGARRIAERGAVVRPLDDKELRLQVCLASRSLLKKAPVRSLLRDSIILVVCVEMSGFRLGCSVM
jgi:hypothetical protein